MPPLPGSAIADANVCGIAWMDSIIQPLFRVSSPVVPVVHMGSPREIFCSVIMLVAIEMSANLTMLWLSVPRLGHQPMSPLRANVLDGVYCTDYVSIRPMNRLALHQPKHSPAF